MIQYLSETTDLKCDYEILDQRKYSDVIKRRPHEVED